MKRVLTILAGTLSAIPTQAAVGDTVDLSQGYVAEGVDAVFANGVLSFGKTELQSSTRFYDSQKGWVSGSSNGDNLMCWAHTASNMIQYWQSYYGVFYKGSEQLPYGSNYKRELYNIMNPGNSPDITDPMRLNVMKALKDSGFTNQGGEVASGTNWFFTWVDSQGGYYSDYFGAIRNGQANPTGQTATITAVNSLTSLKSALLPALGLAESGDSCTQTESGLIAHLNVTNGSNPHTLTCYGLTTDESGNIESLIIADSDDCRLTGYESTTGSTGPDGTYTPKLTQLFVQEGSAGKLLLYTDAARETPFISGQEYYVSGITQINTPEVLQNMLAEYGDVANEAQVWNGEATIWENQTATTEHLPTASTGWDVHVDGSNIEEKHHGYYHSYATEGRNVRFDSHAAEGKRSITIVGTVSATGIEVAAAGYEFKAGKDAELKEGSNLSVLHLADLSSEVELRLTDLTLESGSTLSSTTDISVAGDFRTLVPATVLSTRSTVTPSPSIDADLDLTTANSIELACGVDMNGHKLSLSANTPITLNFNPSEGEMSLFTHIGTLNIDGTDIHNGTELSSHLRLANDKLFTGYSLVYANNTLSLVIPEPSSATLSILVLAALATRRRRK